MAFSHTHDEQEDGHHDEPRVLTANEQTAANARDAVKAVVACLSTDIIDPGVGAYIQKTLATWAGLKEHGTLKDTISGELVGDVTSGVVLFTARQFCPETMRWLSRELSKPLEPLYDKLAPKSVRYTDNPEKMQRRVEAWKQYQRDNIANTLLFSAGGIAANVAVQKLPLLGRPNPSPWPHILVAKIAGATVTAAVLIGSHALFPRSMKKLDHELSEHIFEPVTDFATRLLGIPDKPLEAPERHSRGHYTDKMLKNKNNDPFPILRA